jgi:uncharacterized protein YyaL (SSP411 family)
MFIDPDPNNFSNQNPWTITPNLKPPRTFNATSFIHRPHNSHKTSLLPFAHFQTTLGPLEMSNDLKSKRPTNRLAGEKSPYLLQHQHNPVDWHAWGVEAFAQARTENKPIFLSIGYSTCHWCHVMERESFENDQVAEFLNQHFICIKVDREERPDVDKIYMTAVQAMVGQGGWPLSVFLTPDLKPFYGGTYFPPDNRYGRPGFLQLLNQIQKVWQGKNAELLSSAADLHEKLAKLTSTQPSESGPLSPGLVTNLAEILKKDFDSEHGGFGQAPKFPQPSLPALLLRYGVRFKDETAINMVLKTCERMAAGGIYDQLGGGFARYSVDQIWLVPHFEKMLYDNAQLLNLYLDAFLVSGNSAFADVVHSIISYVRRDMTHPDGGFYSAEDADSEGKEGKFYCWTHAELERLLSPEEFNVATHYFGITREGNFLDHSDPNPLPGQNVLSVVNPDVSGADRPLLAAAKAKMFATRTQRIRPHLDDKILASWNGLMLGAISRAAKVLARCDYLVLAEKNAEFIQKRLWNAHDQTLYHRWRDNECDSVQLLNAYAFQLAGQLSLYEASLKPEHLEFCIQLANAMLKRFYDPEQGGFWQSAVTSDLILRIKEDYDGAEPSGNSVATLALLKLAAITGRADFKKAAEKTLYLFAERLQKLPQAVPFMMLALDYYLEEPRRVVIAGAPDSAETKALIQAAHAVYQPNKVVLGTIGPVEPFAQTLAPQKGAKSTAYLCTGTACQPPVDEPEAVKAFLRK